MTMAVLEQEAQLRSRAAGFAAANLTEGEQQDTGTPSPALSPSQPPASETPVMPFRGGLFGFEPAQQYQKKKDRNSATETSSSWQSSSTTNSSTNNATVASSEVAKRMPQRIIPKSDKSIPLDSDTGRPMVKQLSKRFSFANSTTTTMNSAGNTMTTSKRGSPQPDGEVQL
eukprot:gene33928-43833_t